MPSDATVASPVTPLPATDINAPITGSAGASALSQLGSWLGAKATAAVTPSTSFLANGGLIVVGVILGIAALVVSQRETIIQVGKTAAKAAAI